MLILTALGAFTAAVIGWHALRKITRDLDAALARQRAQAPDEPAVPNPHRNTHE